MSGGHGGPRRMSLREQLRRPGAPIIGTFVLLPRPEVIEIIAATGFAAVMLDLEHGPYGPADLLALLAAARAAGIYSVVRTQDANPAVLANILDLGPDGVVVPHVGSASDARQVATATRFAPTGTRSVNPYVRGLGYLGDRSATRDADEGTAVLCMIEGQDGLAESSEIAATPGIDGLFVGPVDLSLSMGLPVPEPEHPTVVARITSLVGDLDASGVGSGIYAPNVTAAARWIGMGVRLVVVSADSAVLGSAFSGLIGEITSQTSNPVRPASTGDRERAVEQ
jgi:2-keto-3-deoxy-L-rhamnonate aldolase RhmA